MTQHPGDEPTNPPPSAPSAPPYGQPDPQYGHPAPSYGQPTQPYGQSPPPYGQPPVYGTPAPGGPAPAPPTPPPGYAAPGYGAAPGGGYPPSGPPGGPRPGGRPGGPGPIGNDGDEERQWALFAHLGGVLAIFPVIHLVPALVIYSVYRKRSEFVRDQAREAVNFQIVVLIALVAAWIINHLPLLPNLVALVWIFSLVFSVLGAIAASQGDRYRYPLTHRFLT